MYGEQKAMDYLGSCFSLILDPDFFRSCRSDLYLSHIENFYKVLSLYL